MKKLDKGFRLPSAAYTVPRKALKGYMKLDRIPQIGDLIYGQVESLGQHSSLENSHGRIHTIHQGTKAVFVFGNRYAPDYYEGLIPTHSDFEKLDLLARSGVVGEVKSKSGKVISPTSIKPLGYVCDAEGEVVNARDYNLIKPKKMEKKFPRAKLILAIGTAMNSGKSAAATACVHALSVHEKEVRASKVTGTASLKDILNMNDAGATYFSDFSFLGYPSTYMLDEDQIVDVFNKLDLKYANNKDNYWVVEFADGINQRETAMLLKHPDVRKRIHKLIFCAADSFGAIGGLEVLKNKFDLVPDAISGVCSSSPLHIKELSEYTDIPVFNSLNMNATEVYKILNPPRKRKTKEEL
ncbi:hypothetical protein [Algoriphagus sediminis]|uniref:DUF1611 domain-containing protein n=1 Tax=Algoriphagus sediminis TaxID=3057113 RepID=A0ABT7Y9D2_9BACT|nr:hypothetical protein [Algoriphagus sediminis]MDN3202814.1 hypothetical protein [Algoriphagus sediminis]